MSKFRFVGQKEWHVAIDYEGTTRFVVKFHNFEKSGISPLY